MSASCADVSVVSDEGYETPKVDTEEGIPEEVDKSVTGAKFCESGGDVDEVCDVKVEVGSVVTGEDLPEDACSMPVTGIEVCVTV